MPRSFQPNAWEPQTTLVKLSFLTRIHCAQNSKEEEVPSRNSSGKLAATAEQSCSKQSTVWQEGQVHDCDARRCFRGCSESVEIGTVANPYISVNKEEGAKKARVEETKEKKNVPGQLTSDSADTAAPSHSFPFPLTFLVFRFSRHLPLSVYRCLFFTFSTLVSTY